jgi:hypothetical protein
MLTVGQPFCERSGLLPHARVGWMLPSEEYLNWGAAAAARRRSDPELLGVKT